MITLHETIKVHRPAAEAFHYLADFTRTEEWDATVRHARKLTAGPLAVGTEFLVNCALPVGSVDLRYRIERFEPDQVLELRGESSLFTVTDVITFSETRGVTEIDYQATFEFSKPLQLFAKGMESGMQRMGKASVAGLKEALEKVPATPRITPRSTVGRVARFTRHGFNRGRSHWQPMSADLRNRHMVITGASSGIGLASARVLAERGARLTLVMRDPKRAEAIVAELRKQSGNEAIRVEIADLALLADVDALVARLLAAGEPIDVLVNNAGALFNERQETGEGIERSLALLLLSPYRLTLGLEPLLLASGDARVINVVSGGMYTQRLNVARLPSPEDQPYAGAVAYARAKRALMTVTQDWARRWRGKGIAVNAMHPGWADTPGVEKSLPLFHTITRLVLRSPEEGADTIVWLAAAREATTSGRLYMDREPQPLYLREGTRESAGERRKLREFLAPYTPEPTAARRRRASA